MQYEPTTEIQTPEKTRRPNPLSKIKAPFKLNLDWENATAFQGGPTRRAPWKLAVLSSLAALIDGLIIFALSCLFILSAKKFMQLTLTLNIGSLWRVQDLGLAFALTYLLVIQTYLLSTRWFFARTLGEWACDFRLGRPYEYQKRSYLFRVFLRSILIVATGVIVLPILSLLFRTDLAGKIVGLRLFSIR